VFNKTTGDLHRSNDTSATKTIQISSFPILNLANNKDTLGFKPIYTLDAGAGYTTYLWNTSATTRTINISTPGWYRVTVSNSAGCQTKDSVYMKDITSITELGLNNDLILYPNPASSILNVDIKNIYLEDPVIEVYSIDLKLMYIHSFNGKYEEFHKVLDLKGWNGGLYYIRLADYTNKKFFFSKVVIE
jgi:hypothetical protein